MDSVQQIYVTNQTPLSQTFRASLEKRAHGLLAYSPLAPSERALLWLLLLLFVAGAAKSGSSTSNAIPSSNSVKASESVDIILEKQNTLDERSFLL